MAANNLSRSLSRFLAPCQRHLHTFLRFVWVMDWQRLPDPVSVLARGMVSLPRGSAILIRSDPRPRPLSDYITLARMARSQGYRVLAATALSALPAYLIDGRHVSEAARRRPIRHHWRPRHHKKGVLTFAVHDVPGLYSAAQWGADAVFLSAAFPTASHPGHPPLPCWQFRDLCRRSPLPVLALGGINPLTVGRLNTLPIAGIAAFEGWRKQNHLPGPVKES